MTDASKPAEAPASGLISLTPEGVGEVGFCAGGVCTIPERKTNDHRQTVSDNPAPAVNGPPEAVAR